MLKDYAYYNSVPVEYPMERDFRAMYVYDKGTVVVNGLKPDELSDDEIAGYRKAGFLIYTDTNKAAYAAAKDKYRSAKAALRDEFKIDLFAHHGLDDVSAAKANRAYTIACDERTGFQEIAEFFDDLVQLIK